MEHAEWDKYNDFYEMHSKISTDSPSTEIEFENETVSESGYE